jgi:hypothetical protein
LREFNLTGAPVDLYRLSDLEDMDISQYRLIVPLNAFVLNSAKWSQLKARIPKNTTIFWNYAPGVVGDHFSLDNITRLTDFSVRERKPCKNIELFFENMSDIKWRADNDMDTFPVLEIVPEGEQQILGRYSDGGIAMATTDHCVYCTVPLLKAEHLRSIMKIAGCHFYAPVGTIVYADNRFIAVFSDAKINFTMSFPAHCNISNAVTGETYSCKDSIPLSLKKHSMCFFTF